MPRLLPLRLLVHHSRRLIRFSNPRVRRGIIVFLIVYFLLLPLLLFLYLGHVFNTSSLAFPSTLWQAKHILIVVAHPDDEALFFNPTILALTQRKRAGARVGLLVLSSGNNYGLGAIRKAELQRACVTLKIWDSHCSVLDVPELQDNPKQWWPRDSIQKIVDEYVKTWKINSIVTFDSGGVSGHANHRAIHDAVRDYSTRSSQAPPTYFLRTTSLFRKYTLLGDLPFTALKHFFLCFFSRTDNHALFVNSWQLYRQGIRGFSKHDSQFQWDRHLYVVFSRYMWFNDLYLANPKR